VLQENTIGAEQLRLGPGLFIQLENFGI